MKARRHRNQQPTPSPPGDKNGNIVLMKARMSRAQSEMGRINKYRYKRRRSCSSFQYVTSKNRLPKIEIIAIVGGDE